MLNAAGELTSFRFQSKTCAACPLRAKCTTARRVRLRMAGTAVAVCAGSCGPRP